MTPNPSVEFNIVSKTQDWVEKLEKAVLARLNEEMDKVWEEPLIVKI